MENDLISRAKLIDEMESHIYWGDSVIGLLEVAKNAPAVEAEPKWVSVNDRLPEDGVDVIVYTDRSAGTVESAYYRHNRGAWFQCCCLLIPNVLYWMPLPEPPKGTAIPGKPENCKYYTPNCFWGGGGCLGTKEIDPCEGENCKRWMPKMDGGAEG